MYRQVLLTRKWELGFLGTSCAPLPPPAPQHTHTHTHWSLTASFPTAVAQWSRSWSGS